MVHYPRGWGMASNTPFRSTRDSRTPVGCAFPFSSVGPRGLTSSPAVKCDANTVRHRPLRRCSNSPASSAEAVSRRRGRGARWRQFRRVVNDSDYLSAHREQIRFMGNRSFYKDGWKLVTLHRPNTPYDDQEWELYDIRETPPSATTSRPNDQNWFASFQQRGSAVRGTTRSSRSMTSLVTWEPFVDRLRID